MITIARADRISAVRSFNIHFRGEPIKAHKVMHAVASVTYKYPVTFESGQSSIGYNPALHASSN